MTVDFNIEILNNLLKEDSFKSINISERFPKINIWRQQIEKPTIAQLSGLASYFNVPFGYFFLNAIPKKDYPIPHYRSVGNQPFKPSEELLDTIQILQERQEWAIDVIKDLRGEPLTFAHSVSIKDSIQATAQKMRSLLNVPINWAENLKSLDEAFRLLITKTENIGIFVVVNGVVNNNTKRKLSISELRGLVLYDNYAPFIFINGNDFNSGKIFTIVHEIVHVLIGSSASFDLNKLLPANNQIETFCDAVAAEFLVPESFLLEKIQANGKNYEMLSKFFKVSRLVIARRLFDLKKIDRQEFSLAYETFKKAAIEKKVVVSTGGNFYNTAPYRISKNFFLLIYSAVKQNKLLYRDAFKLTGLTSKSFDGYVNKHLK